jgi:hypothetical protein
MSSANRPLSMKTMPSSGYNHNSSQQRGYVPQKGTGILSNPVGITASHIRPLTNNDMGNVFKTGFGLARPIKHYRKGRVIPISMDDINLSNENKLILYNSNRIVKSSTGGSLGGGSGGFGLLNQVLDTPGSFLVKQNTEGETFNTDCQKCQGVGLIASYYPNQPYLTENPEPNTQTPKFCCNEERKAKRRVIYANTNLKKNYYTTHKQYLQNRCQTYEQKVFNFMQPTPVSKDVKPGSALSLDNTYFANCFPNGEIYQTTEDALVTKLVNIMLSLGIITQSEYDAFIELKNLTFRTLFGYIQSLPEPEKTNAIKMFVEFINNPYIGVPFAGPSNKVGCKLTVYKPSNPQFANEGAVDSSTRNLKLNVDTISTNAYSLNKPSTPNNLLNVNDLTRGTEVNVPFILKNKSTPCNIPPVYYFQNKKSCSNFQQRYNTPNTTLPYSANLNYINYQLPFSSNHFSQSPNTYNTPSSRY